MNFKDYLIEISSFIVIIPAAILCLLPMKNQFRFSAFGMALRTALVMVIAIPILALISYLIAGGSTNTVLLPSMVLFYFLYHKSLKVSYSKSIAIFLYVMAYLAVLSDIAHGIIALVYRSLNSYQGNLYFALIQVGISIIFTVCTWYSFSKYGSELIDSLTINNVWLATLPISIMIILLSLRTIPQKYETLYVNNVFKAFWFVVIAMLLFLVFWSIVFYYVFTEIRHSHDLENKNKMLEFQESLFIRTQQFLAETAETRHNFKQTIYTLKGLADGNNLESIKEYLSVYSQNISQNDIVSYCKNRPLNALLNHYIAEADFNNIKINLGIDLPDELNISDIDLCSITGNILDNAITANIKVDIHKRFINFVISQNQNSHIYIMAENSFDGKPKKKKGHYLSTNRKGNGIGLASIDAAAKRYCGTSRFYNDEEKFYSEVML